MCFGEGWKRKACGVAVCLLAGDTRCTEFAESDAVGEEFRVEFSVELSVVELSVELELLLGDGDACCGEGWRRLACLGEGECLLRLEVCELRFELAWV